MLFRSLKRLGVAAVAGSQARCRVHVKIDQSVDYDTGRCAVRCNSGGRPASNSGTRPAGHSSTASKAWTVPNSRRCTLPTPESRGKAATRTTDEGLIKPGKRDDTARIPLRGMLSATT